MKQRVCTERSSPDEPEPDASQKKTSWFSSIKIFLVSECALMLAQGTVGAYLVSRSRVSATILVLRAAARPTAGRCASCVSASRLAHFRAAAPLPLCSAAFGQLHFRSEKRRKPLEPAAKHPGRFRPVQTAGTLAHRGTGGQGDRGSLVVGEHQLFLLQSAGELLGTCGVKKVLLSP